MMSLAEPFAEEKRGWVPILPQRWKDPSTPAFIVGVAGYMRLDAEDAAAVRDRLQLIFRLLREGGAAKVAEDSRATLASALADLLAPRDFAGADRARETYERALHEWRGLGTVPIVVMSNLAPGADTIAADVACKLGDPGFRFRAPLPFPHDQYADASTFVHGDDGDVERRRAYLQTLDLIGRENTFAVRTEADFSLDERGFREQTIRDRDVKPKRDARYYAAGEYLAAYSQLLIVVWNGTDGSERGMIERIVEARLRGPQAGVLPGTKGVRLAQGAPLLHLFASDPKKPDLNERVPPARLLHPFAEARDAASKEAAKTWPDTTMGRWIVGRGQSGLLPTAGVETSVAQAYAKANDEALTMQRTRFAIFCRAAINLRSFVEQSRRPAKDVLEARFRAMIVDDKKEVDAEAKYLAFTTLRMRNEPPDAEEGEYSRSLRPIADLRAWASAESGKLRDKNDATLFWLFVLTFAAAACLHVLSHWHPPHGSETASARNVAGDESSAKEASAEASDPQSPAHHHPAPSHGEAADRDDHASHHGDNQLSIVRIVAGLLALGFAAAALSRFVMSHAHSWAERDHDFRAIGEGLRVQFYWNLAGIGRSVSANYMHRQRSELDWIRAAVRSASFPYETSRVRFERLERRDRLFVLERVKRTWIDGQHAFFLKWKGLRRRLHAWHMLGAVLAIAGVLMAILYLLQNAGAPLFTEFRALSALVASPFTLGLALWFAFVVVRAAPPRKKSEASGGTPEPIFRYLRRIWRPRAWLDDFTCSHDAHNDAGDGFWRRVQHSCLSFFERLPLAFGLTGLIFLASLLLHAIGTALLAETWGLIFAGVLLLAGAMCVAWSEKTLLSETAYQYHVMHAMFADAALRMDEELERLKKLLPKSTNEDETQEARDVQEAQEREFDAKVVEIQDYLYALGKEALDENAEWLLLHRARPLEPVMAG